jgi:hypothetical protein
MSFQREINFYTVAIKSDLLVAPGNQDGLRHGEPRHFVHVGNVGLIIFQHPVTNSHLQAPSYRPGTCSDDNCSPGAFLADQLIANSNSSKVKNKEAVPVGLCSYSGWFLCAEVNSQAESSELFSNKSLSYDKLSQL